MLKRYSSPFSVPRFSTAVLLRRDITEEIQTLQDKRTNKKYLRKKLGVITIYACKCTKEEKQEERMTRSFYNR